MNDQQKSVLLAKAMGRLEYDENNIPGLRTWTPVVNLPGETWTYFPMPNLYDPANMALAWRVLNWAWIFYDDHAAKEDLDLEWHEEIDGVVYFDSDPADAQRLWLDKIVELIEVDDE